MTNDTRPLVSCVMPTANRRAFVPQAIRYFLRQDYLNKELLVIDDGAESVVDLVPSCDSIRYIRLPQRMSLGAKRNLGCEQARGDLIVHWDDDDWYAGFRLRYQVESLLSSTAEICGSRRPLFFDPALQRAWRFVYPEHEKIWVAGSSLCYRRGFWSSNRFSEMNVGEDTLFIWNARPDQVLVLNEHDFIAALIHPQNTSPKQTTGGYFETCSVDSVRSLLGSDWPFYRPEDATTPISSMTAQDGVDVSVIAEMRVARATDLDLPEFRAFNQGQHLPRMRQWELPFALFAAQLSNNVSVLNCTINPATFEQRLLRLYPHTLYRSWNPIQNGAFALPLGIPDGAFDRVICVNTLEHLLRAQRETLFADLTRKLKPGGRMILTSDLYFDSSWTNPTFLQAGVVRADRQEIFNGWNKVSPKDYSELSLACGLESLPGSGVEAAPIREDDSSVFLQQSPFAHACFAGVFQKPGGPAVLPAHRKIVLALLTWNTRDISLDSAHALLVEARMLKRLGYEPSLCLTDNGSTDGTAEALQALEAETDVPCTFVMNGQNLGNSIARNQIIDHAMKAGADYLLFMDGDIEVVPFSTFAMIRYLENNGERLGCVGADSWGQTPHRHLASPCLYSATDCRIENVNLVAWTQYGLFRREVFETGIRFDVNGPFGGPGWGFEDNDLAFQMDVKGFVNHRMFGMTYLHRAMGSSIRELRAQGADVAAMYSSRRDYVIEKWSGVPEINGGPLVDLRRAAMSL
jgi:glycosyltransferase involved in cell wall biosynthesis/SAM-dependent methyltransferase